MQTRPQESLQKLREEWERLKKSEKEIESLLKEREERAEKVHALKEELTQMTEEMYRTQSYNPKKAAEIEEKIGQLRTHLKTSEKELKQLDTLLEKSGEDNHKEIAQLEEELIRLIHQKYPQAREEYVTLEKDLREAEALYKEVQKTRAELHTFYTHLQEGASTRDTPRNRGVFGTLFGRNPTVILAEHINRATKEAQSLLKRFDPTKGPLYDQIHTFLKEFVEDTSKPWNQSLYNQKFFDLFAHFSSLINELDNEIATLKARLSELKTEKEKWIEKYAVD